MVTKGMGIHREATEARLQGLHLLAIQDSSHQVVTQVDTQASSPHMGIQVSSPLADTQDSSHQVVILDSNHQGDTLDNNQVVMVDSLVTQVLLQAWTPILSLGSVR